MFELRALFRSAMPLDGDKVLLERFKSYLAAGGPEFFQKILIWYIAGIPQLVVWGLV